MTDPDAPTAPEAATTQDPLTDENDVFDRHSRRVLWALPTGLYLVGSRFEDRVNLMTANLVVQVCLEPKLVAAAIEAGSVTADLITRSGAFSLSLLSRHDPAVVRRFVKPVADMERDADGTVVALSGHAVRESGPSRLPVLAAATGSLVAQVTEHHALGSHVLFIGQVIEVEGEPSDVLRMEDTRMHYGG
jgi:flavin reductase (DIM6/NTAB) family NADH-FMN oxidoreductase RutF